NITKDQSGAAGRVFMCVIPTHKTDGWKHAGKIGGEPGRPERRPALDLTCEGRAASKLSGRLPSGLPSGLPSAIAIGVPAVCMRRRRVERWYRAAKNTDLKRNEMSAAIGKLGFPLILTLY